MLLVVFINVLQFYWLSEGVRRLFHLTKGEIKANEQKAPYRWRGVCWWSCEREESFLQKIEKSGLHFNHRVSLQIRSYRKDNDELRKNNERAMTNEFMKINDVVYLLNENNPS